MGQEPLNACIVRNVQVSGDSGGHRGDDLNRLIGQCIQRSAHQPGVVLVLR